MGADSSKGLSRHVEAQNKNSNAKVIPEEYKPCFEAYKANPNFLSTLTIIKMNCSLRIRGLLQIFKSCSQIFPKVTKTSRR